MERFRQNNLDCQRSLLISTLKQGAFSFQSPSQRILQHFAGALIRHWIGQLKLVSAQQLLHPLIVFFLQLYGFALTADALQAMTWSNDSQDDDQI